MNRSTITATDKDKYLHITRQTFIEAIQPQGIVWVKELKSLPTYPTYIFLGCNREQTLLFGLTTYICGA